MSLHLFSGSGTKQVKNMAIPPYILGPNAWASMMVQQQAAHAQLAAAQAHAQAHAQAQVVAQAQAAHAHAQMHALQQAQQPVPMPLPKQPEVLTEEKLQEKGRLSMFRFVIIKQIRKNN